MKGIDSFISLLSLNLDNNKIPSLTSLKHLRALESLSLRNNQISSLRGLEGLSSLKYANFSMNQLTQLKDSDFKHCKGLTELDLAENPIRNFEGLCYLSELDTLDLSYNKNLKDFMGVPDLERLGKLKAENCRVKNLKFVHSKFPSLNIINVKNNDITLYEEIEDIKKIEYLAELDIRYNPIEKMPAVQEMIVADVPDLEVYNQIELLEPGYRYKVMNEEIKKYLEDTKDEEEEKKMEGIVDEAFNKIKEEHGEDLNLEKLNQRFQEVEDDHMKNEAEMVKAQMSISANLQPLMRDQNSLKEMEETTPYELVKESVEYNKKLKKDYSQIRGDFRHIMNQLRLNEFDTFNDVKKPEENQDLKDPYSNMAEEIQKIDQEQKAKGFLTSYSEANDSGDEEPLLDQVPLQKSDKLNQSASKASKKQVGRRKSSISIRSSKKALPFRSSAGFGAQRQKSDLTGKNPRKFSRAGSARKRKLPPTSKQVDQLNQLRELKIDEEKDKILNEFNTIVSKTSTDFKKPKFPTSSRKKVLQPIRTYSKQGSSSETDPIAALKNITKYNKPNMLAAQNEMIANMLSNKN